MLAVSKIRDGARFITEATHAAGVDSFPHYGGVNYMTSFFKKTPYGVFLILINECN